MAAMISEVYAAFLDAGASPEKAQKAAEAIARHVNRLNKVESDLNLLKWMVGTNIALSMAVAVRLFVV